MSNALKENEDVEVEVASLGVSGETSVDGNIMPEAESIEDSPLYQNDAEAPWNDDTGWKTVDVSDNVNDPDEVPRGEACSGGGGGTPSPNTPGTSPCSDDQEPEHPRSTPGAPSTALITLKAEHSEHSERSETFSSTDFDDPDWISPIYPESSWLSLVAMDEPPYYTAQTKDGSEKVTGLNDCFFSVYTVLKANLHMHHKDWYAYSEEKGVWHRLNKAELMRTVRRCVVLYGKNLQIEEFLELCSFRFRKEVVEGMEPFPDYEDIFDHAPKNVINVKNGTIVVGNDGSIALHEHSPEFLCRDVINIDYDPTANYNEFVHEAFRDVVTPEDQKIIQMYAGQCALGWNMSQTILIVCGEASTGKSSVVKVIEKVLGRNNYEGLRTNMLNQRFELSRFEGKSLLVASDQCSDALMKKGAHMLKSLTGDDDLTTERKGENEHSMITGEFNVIIVSNSDLPLSIDGDSGAWRRRIRPVVYSGELPKTFIRRFPDLLLRKYPKQILNWMVEGVAALRRNGDSIDPHPEMLSRIDALIQESDACLAFVKNCVVRTGNREDVLFSFGLYNAFTASSYFVGSGSKQIIRTKLKKAMKDVYGVKEPRHDLKDSDGRTRYGYVGYQLELNGPE